MRLCEDCSKPDSYIVDYETKCDRTLCRPDADERPETHHDNCPKLTHDVVRLERVAKLISTPRHPEGQLEHKYIIEGWKLLKNGMTWMRYRMLCQSCVRKVYDREARQKEYMKACKKARGEDDRTYNQLLTQQSMQ